MLKTTKFSIGGYNFDDWSLVKELYVPTDVTDDTDRSLHVRGREDFPGSTTQRNAALNHHLQHYVIPYGKVFIAFAVGNVKMTSTATIGLFGTGKAYGRYPLSHQETGEPIAWSGTHYDPMGDDQNHNYYRDDVWGSLVIHYSKIYMCEQTHMPDPTKEPGTVGGEDWWETHDVIWDVNYRDDTWYYKNELAMVTVEGVEGAYMCQVDHTSSSENKPCSGVNWDYGDGLGSGIWDPGDEFQADLSSQFGFSEDCLNVSEGTEKPFSSDIIAVFPRHTENTLRRIDAFTIGDTMKAGATLYGIEVDA